MESLAYQLCSLLAAALASPKAVDRCRAAAALRDLNTPEKGGQALLQKLVARILQDVNLHPSCYLDGLDLVDTVYSVLGPEGLSSRYVFSS